MIDLSSAAVGGRVVDFNDEFFAPAANLLSVGPAVWKPDKYVDTGKWMDGWETRRRREPGHDWCVVALGIPGRLREVVVDTAHFTGNYPEAFSLDVTGGDPQSEWTEAIARTALTGDTEQRFGVDLDQRVRHVRLNIYPDGGVARLRIFGDPIPDPAGLCGGVDVDLAAAAIGGSGTDSSNAHYSSPSNLVLPTEPLGMWDGWETRRRRGPGHDWAIVELGVRGRVVELVVDTHFFKGNSPGWVSLDVDTGSGWHPALPKTPVSPDTANHIKLTTPLMADRVRLNIIPDGGVARIRVLGSPAPESLEAMGITYLNSLSDPEMERLLLSACSSQSWVAALLDDRPFASPEDLQVKIDQAFAQLEQSDWLEAFAGHPRIGERGGEIANSEQAGARSASKKTLDDLTQINRAYEDRFGFTYIVYASGKSAEEMLAMAQNRIDNARDQEIKIAAVEQMKITNTRLDRILCRGEKK